MNRFAADILQLHAYASRAGMLVVSGAYRMSRTSLLCSSMPAHDLYCSFAGVLDRLATHRNTILAPKQRAQAVYPARRRWPGQERLGARYDWAGASRQRDQR